MVETDAQGRTLWDSREVAAYFRVGLNTVYAKCRNGEWSHLDGSGPGGKRYLFRAADIEAIEATLARPAAPVKPVRAAARRRRA